MKAFIGDTISFSSTIHHPTKKKQTIQAVVLKELTNSVICDVSSYEVYEHGETIVNHKNYKIIQKKESA